MSALSLLTDLLTRMLAALAPAAGPLVSSALGAVVLALAVLLLTRSRLAVPPRAAALLWWLVAAKAMAGVFWSVPLPLLPATLAEPLARIGMVTPAPAPARAVAVSAVEVPSQAGAGAWRGAPAAPAPRAARIPSRTGSLRSAAGALVALWMLGAVAALALAARSILRLRGVARRALPVEDLAQLAALERISATLGMTRAPRLLRSAEVTSPLVLGLRDARIVLPAAPVTSVEELELALAHELLHLRHHDLIWGLVPAAAERLFFFHPLVRLAAREYSLAVESACDREVLSRLGPAPERYGRLLLHWGVAPRAAVASAAAASPTFKTLRRRLEMLEHRSRKLGAAGAATLAAAFVFAIPFHPVAAMSGGYPADRTSYYASTDTKDDSVPPARSSSTWRRPPVPPVPPTPPIPPAPPDATVPGFASIPPVPPVAPVPPVPPVPPMPPRSLITGDGPVDAFAMVWQHGTTTIQTGRYDIPTARLRHSGEDAIWFRYEGKAYEIHDAATMARVAKLFEAQVTLGDRQAKLGDQQAALGNQQAKLGNQQARIADQEARLAMQQSSEAERQRAETQRAEIERQTEQLSKQQDELSQKQDQLSKQQDELGAQQDRYSAEAERQLLVLLQAAIADGTAKPAE